VIRFLDNWINVIKYIQCTDKDFDIFKEIPKTIAYRYYNVLRKYKKSNIRRKELNYVLIV